MSLQDRKGCHHVVHFISFIYAGCLKMSQSGKPVKSARLTPLFGRTEKEVHELLLKVTIDYKVAKKFWKILIAGPVKQSSLTLWICL